MESEYVFDIKDIDVHTIEEQYQPDQINPMNYFTLKLLNEQIKIGISTACTLNPFESDYKHMLDYDHYKRNIVNAIKLIETGNVKHFTTLTIILYPDGQDLLQMKLAVINSISENIKNKNNCLNKCKIFVKIEKDDVFPYYPIILKCT